MPDPTPFIEFAKEPDAIILLKSLAAGFGINSETRNDISNYFSRKLEDERLAFDPRAELEAFEEGRPFGEGSADNQKSVNMGQVGRAFGLTAAALAGRAAVKEARKQQLVGPSVLSKTKTLINTQHKMSRELWFQRNALIHDKRKLFRDNNINDFWLDLEKGTLDHSIEALQESLDSEFMAKAEENITKDAIARKQHAVHDNRFLKDRVAELKDPSKAHRAMTTKRNFTLEERLRLNIIDTLDKAISKKIQGRFVIEKIVDDVLSRGKLVARAAGRVGGPAAIVFAAREFQKEMKLLQEQKHRALHGLEPAGVVGDPIGP